MRRLAQVLVCAASLIGASAQAQAIDATGDVSGVINLGGFPMNVPGGTGSVVIGLDPRTTVGGSVESIVSITSNHISFESGVAVSGPDSGATSFSSVDVTVTNIGEGDLSIANFGSTIIPAGLGFYLQDRSGGVPWGENIYTGYPQTFSGLEFGDLSTTVGVGDPFAYADFDFLVSTGETTLYALSGWLSLSLNGQGGVDVGYGLDDASLALDGFVTAYDTPFAHAYAWDATDIIIPLNAYLTPGQSQVITYATTVTAFTRAPCIDDFTCLVAYSGFGDPIGRGGGVDSLSIAAFGAGDFKSFDVGGIQGIVFDPVTFEPFRFLDGPGGGAVPEPSTWLTMIMGFGLLGAALRRRRSLSYC